MHVEAQKYDQCMTTIQFQKLAQRMRKSYDHTRLPRK